MPRVDSNVVRLRIHERIRKHLSGTEARPRLCVFRSNKHIYAQIVDDSKGQTLVAASTCLAWRFRGFSADSASTLSRRRTDS